MTDFSHIPVLKSEVIEYIAAGRGGVFLDGTVGLGGHSAAILDAAEGNYVYGTDKDTEALAFARRRLAAYSNRFSLFQADFRQIESLPVQLSKVDGFLFDLGISSYQLDDPARGFSYARETPLDMRMDRAQKLTARQVVNHYSYEALSRILKNYGEFKDPARLTQQIVFHRKQKEIITTADLKEVVRRICPRRPSMDPLARVFQAIRIEVNRELDGLERFFIELIGSMKPGSRIVIISFHSLEDRIVKSVFKQARESRAVEILTRKPVTPGEEEAKANLRARSAKLRAAEKV